MKHVRGIAMWCALSMTALGQGFPADLTGSDLGAPALAGDLQTNTTGGLVIRGGGTGIGLRRDEGHFAWTVWEGDFDFAVRVESFSAANLFGRAGLMVRTSFEADGAFAGVFGTPTAAGVLFQYRLTPGGLGRQTGGVPVNYPYTWLRLRRTGNVFTGAASSDGTTWTQLDSASLDATNSVYLGLVVCGWSSDQLATAVFREWSQASGPLLPASTPALELPGPSTRRTGLVISEIMYHPPPRPDGRILEFVEVYNSQSIFADLSGFQLAGAIQYTFPPGTVLAPGEFVVVARSPGDMRATYGLTNVLGSYTSTLDTGSGVVRLLSPIKAVLVEAPYDSQPPWPAAADGAGHSLVLAAPSYGERDVRAWSASAFLGGSPGRWDVRVQDPLSHVSINELRARSTAPLLDYIELYNHANQAVDLSGCFLSDTPGLDRYRIPEGTSVSPAGFLALDQATLGFGLKASGGSVYLVAPDGLRVVDAVRYPPQLPGAAYGRTPDGAPRLEVLAQATPGQANSAARQSEIVINEIMYHPVSGDPDDQYVELHNRSASAVSLGGWRFTSGIRFTFPANTLLASGGYVVIARNAARLIGSHPELTSTTCLGDFQGTLSGKGERLALSRPDGQDWIVVSEVTYGTGGRWGRWSDGGGSSLELIDPRADPALAANWADSDESGKGEWTTIEHTGVLDLGNARYGINQVQLMLEDVGECLVDNIEVISPAGTNMLTNGDFEDGMANWTPQGSHKDSTVEPGVGMNGSQALHIRAESRGDPGANRIRATIASGLKTGDTVTLRAQVRWLCGSPEFLIRLRGNYLEATGPLRISSRIGTPGAPNSRALSNAPPAIHDVVHSPIVPGVDQPVVVTARVEDVDGVDSVLLRYRVDPSPDLMEVPMHDDGTEGDAVARDGVFSAIIPGQAAGAMVAFHVAARDRASASGTFPATAPARECLVRFGDPQPGSTFGTYRIWMTQEVRNRWSSREKLSNAPLDVTFVYGNQRVIYNAGALYTGSPFVSSGYSGPTGALCGYVLRLPEDDLFLGAADVKLDWPVRDNSLQMEQVAYWIADQLGIPSNHRRFINLYVNGTKRGAIYEDAQQPNSDMVSQYFPDDEKGELYKIDDWFEFDNAGSGFVNTDATLDRFTTTGGEFKVARYRWNWRKRAVQNSASDYRSLFALVDAVHVNDLERFTRGLEALMDVEEYLGIIAMEHIVGNWDSFGYGRGKNMFSYKPTQGKWSLLTWDIDFVLGAQSDPPNAYLYGTIDSVVGQMMSFPPFQRVYLRALANATNGPLRPQRFGPVLAANYASLVANGLSPSVPSSGSNYMTGRFRTIAQELSQYAAPFTVEAGGGTVSSQANAFLLQGTAPVLAREIRVNGIAYPTTWMDATRWQMRVPLETGSNRLEVAALDTAGREMGHRTVSIEYTQPPEPPEGRLVFNELMYAPSIPRAEFVEFYNNSAFYTFDLSGWRVSGLDYTFPEGTLLGPQAFLVLAQDRTAFWEAYGPDAVPVGVFGGNLAGHGETLRLIVPGASEARDRTVAELTYSNSPPWPAAAALGGVSLQLRDPSQAPNRVGNWAARPPVQAVEWERVTTTGRASSSRLLLYLSALPPIRDLATPEGAWTGTVSFGGGGTWPIRVDFQQAPDGKWEGGWIFEGPDGQDQRGSIPADFSNQILTFGFSPQQPEFRFALTGEVSTISGRYQPPGQNSYPSTLRRFNPGGDVFVDDIWLCKGTVPETGPNLIRNGDFEAALESFWTVPANHLDSGLDGSVSHGDSSSLHLKASIGGHDETDSVWQDVAALEPGETYTLSYWLHLGKQAKALVTRLADWSVVSLRDLKPVKVKPISFSPGEVNSTWAQLPDLPPVWLNECQPVNITGPTDQSGRHSPWVELFNSGSNAVILAGYSLGDAYSNGLHWPFPPAAVLMPGEFRLVWLDGNPTDTTDSEWHASFRLAPNAGTLVFSRSIGDEQQIVDYLEYTNLVEGASIGWAADGFAAQRVAFSEPTPLRPNSAEVPVRILINEWMAANSQAVPDPATDTFEDWFELFNAGDSPVDLTGFTLSDSVTDPRKFVIPAGTSIAARGHLVIWADGHPEKNGLGLGVHANFKLRASGETIVLSAPDGSRIDLVAFGQQLPDVSGGRWPDGAGEPWRTLTEPTPGSVNVWAAELRLTVLWHLAEEELTAAWPSTASQQFQLQAKDNLEDPAWVPLAESISASGSETHVTLPIAAASAHRFFRIVLLP